MKTFFKILAVLVVLLIIAAVAIPLFVSADMLKNKAAQQVSAATGRTLTIGGKASLSLFPDIAVKLEQVTLGNPAGDFQAKHFFAAKEVAVGVKLMPLLNKQVVITGITLDGADIALEQNAAGAKNWDFSNGTQAKATESGVKKESSAAAPVIGTIKVNNASVSYAVAGKPTVALSDINLTLDGADGRGSLKLDASAKYREQKVAVNLEASDANAFMQGAESTIKLSIDAPNTSVKYDGKASKAPSANGKIAVDISDLPATLAWATGKPASASLPKKLSLHSPIIMQNKKLQFSALELQADSMAANAQMNADLAGEVPSINGTVKTGTIDLDTFKKQGSDAKASPAKPATTSTDWDATPIDLSGLRAVNAKLALSLEGIKIGKVSIGATLLNVALQGGALTIGIEKMALYEGNAQGNISVNTGGVAAALDVANVKIDPLMTALSGASRLKGTAALQLNVTARGNSQRSYVQSLNGSTAFTVKDGAVKGINVAKFLRNAQKGFLSEGSEEETDFSTLSASMKFANGVGSTNDISMLSPLLRLSGSGTVSLPPKTMNLRFMPKLVASATGQGGKDEAGITIPFVVAGSWSNPSITPDLAGAAQEALKNPQAVKDTVNQTLKNLKGGVKNLNSPSDLLRALGGGQAAQPAPAAPTEAAPAVGQ